MDAVTEFLENIRAKHLARGHFQGLLHCLIGRRITGPGGELVSAGMTFRDVAALLKKLRWETDDVKELGVDPETLPPRDRQRFWFMAICQAGIDGVQAKAEGDRFSPVLLKEGYHVGPPPGRKQD